MKKVTGGYAKKTSGGGTDNQQVGSYEGEISSIREKNEPCILRSRR